MAAKITFFPVGDGDMTLITLDSGRTILIDINIREAADDPDDETCDVAGDLRERLKRDGQDHPYVDAFLLSHPDQDHCRGLQKHFHLGAPEEYRQGKILIREVWSSPLIFRRASSSNLLCDDARAFNREAKRRVERYREAGATVGDGDRILILGHDEHGKTNDLTDILVEIDQVISQVNGQRDAGLSARLLGPLPGPDLQEEEAALTKNDSSVVLRFHLRASGGECRFLTGGDARVGIWERMWKRHANHTEWLEYDLLQAPHHCSWRSLSRDSWRDWGERAKVSRDAREALGQALSGAHIIASSKPVTDDDNDPPCTRAKREYKDILDPVSGVFKCTGETPKPSKPAPIEFEVDRDGLCLSTVKAAAPAIIASDAGRGDPLPHG
ncbi:metallohydrolase [Endozoicomonas sp. G2_2]|uniref:metallohydrolase n=1 Tax=Endozoicomonas sp. G2_2 TaxID=2821092 RepID=UPI001ADCB5BB|nr:metallohydrolase [Endozoicomonas sp. G2_2]MBO9471648.1 metallohydrolase [Endozoicomonas sp. G2_2]